MSRYARGGVEPSVEEMLGDPVVQAVMERDGVTGERVQSLLSQARAPSSAQAGEARRPDHRPKRGGRG
ncbi:MAG: hypothetical protein HYR63_14005 [Proteobacteria bacterium]|nr:hypothetical protein [Pseudomonadota bacterium]